MSTGWHWMRAVYLIGGVMFCIQAVMLKEWTGMLPGVYFALMGLLGFGCAGGQCRRY